MTAQQQFDQDRAEAFAESLLNALNGGAITLMTSIGHRTGLFDAMAGLPPSTSEEIASAANLNERYVREWLSAMVVGRVVEYNLEDGTYLLPQEHAAFLTRAASLDNIAVTTQFIALMARSRTVSSSASSTAAGCPTRPSPTSMRLWPRTADRRWWRPSRTTSWRWFRA
jgi:winged helix-turn-helix protein